MAFISNPAFWGALAALLASMGVQLLPSETLTQHIIEAVASVAALVGVIMTLWEAGHRVHYEKTAPQKT